MESVPLRLFKFLIDQQVVLGIGRPLGVPRLPKYLEHPANEHHTYIHVLKDMPYSLCDLFISQRTATFKLQPFGC